jgi:peptidyl-prolyl cis-trans isomerase NIMA-interacting 1
MNFQAKPRADRALFALIALAAPLSIFGTACTTLATSPEWVGGGLAVSAPVREAEEEERDKRERAIIAAQPSKVGAKHILVMHAGSRQKPDDVTRSREDAKKRAQEALLKIRGGADFDAVVVEYTDEPGGAERVGNLGTFDRAQMVKPFTDAAFALKVGEVSEIIETPYGFHVIKRTE